MNRVGTAERAAKGKSNISENCVCFPENEQPFFCDLSEELLLFSLAVTRVSTIPLTSASANDNNGTPTLSLYASFHLVRTSGGMCSTLATRARSSVVLPGARPQKRRGYGAELC
jgi:hypothetical protein